MVRGKLERNTRTSQFSIKVVFPDGNIDNMWNGLIDFCSEDYSDNELCQIWRDCNDQLSTMNARDIPLRFRMIMKELTQVMINRHLLKSD